MLLICASEVQKHRRIGKNLATRKTQMLVTAESPPPWTLTSDRHPLRQRQQRQPNVPLSKGLPVMENENSKTSPSKPLLIVNGSSANGFRGRNKSNYKRCSTPSAQNDRQNSADLDKCEQRKVRPNKNQKKQVKSTNEMISSRPTSAGKLGECVFQVSFR